jgi:hypothetical protein
MAGKVVVSGYVRDAMTGEELIGANIAILATGSGTVTNAYGFYSLSLDPGFYTLVCSFVGYHTKSVPLRLGSDTGLNFELMESTIELEEVTITAEAGNENITRVETGSTKLPIQSISGCDQGHTVITGGPGHQ